ncbi:hypothetical protein [Corynebacterium coyleae]|uniref:hypothetical protein n=1 Tax=Corynebacterium coyleae TaxID=53374 RepID=UPI00254CCB64|nr:hypothetical protein [Corynebacterium coyleae]MDK8241886.1 hypothetical protein [Corynebacterium coyleae]
MKKFAAATLAATMALSLGAVDANAASNTMVNYNTTCSLTFDKPTGIKGLRNGTTTPKRVEDQLGSEEASKVVDFAQTSSKLGEAFGSSDETSVNDVNNLAALRACAQGENFKSQPTTDSEKAGIIAGTVISALVLIGGVLAPVVGPMIQQFLPF